MADSSNIKLRQVEGRPLLYEEVDANFQELIDLIDEYDQFEIDINERIDEVENDLTTSIGNVVQSLIDHNIDSEAHQDIREFATEEATSAAIVYSIALG